MLQKIHDKLTGWLAYVVLGAIAAVFVLWGINWTLGAPDYAAKVNGREIPINDVREAYQRELAQLQRASNGNADEAQRTALKKKVIDSFVADEALITRVQGLGYRVSDSDVLAAESQIPAFQVNGKFDMEHAVAVLKASGRSIPQVEGMIRRQVQLQQLDSAMQATAFATDADVKRIDALLRQQREVGWLVLQAARYAAAATPTDADIQAYYDAHKSQFMTPETVDLHYIEISLAKLAANVPVNDAQLRAYFDDQKARNPENYVQAETRRVSHILIQVTNPKDDAAAKAKAEGLLKRIQGGEDFAKLAKQYSQDPGSAPQGGDLGWSERKVWVKPFADAAFGMKVGEVRGPVKTQFGYHIIKLEGIRPAAVKTFDQSKTDIEAEYRKSEAERQFNDLQDKLADAALQNPTDLEAVARKAGLTVQEIPNFSRTDGGGALGKAPKVIEAAFSADVLDGNVSSIVEVEKGTGVVIRATDHKLPQQKPLSAVREAIIAPWKAERGSELALAAAKRVADQLTGGETWAGIAKALVVTPQLPHFVGRRDDAVPIDVRRVAFEAPKPAGKPIYRSVALANGDAVVVGVSAVREDPSGNSPDAIANLRRELAQQYASDDAQTYAAAARDDAKVIVNPQAID